MVSCFGEFHLGHTGCDTCKTVRSCKRESLIRIKSEKQRQKVKSNKKNTLEGLNKERALKILNAFLAFYQKPASTYRITKDFRKHRNINVSDTKILELLQELNKRGLAKVTKQGKARYWYNH